MRKPALETVLASLALGLAVSLGIASYRVSNPFQEAWLIELASLALGLSLALFIVNIYLDRKSRRAAVTPLLMLVAPSIRDHNNAFLKDVWDLFGKPQFDALMRRYAEYHRDPKALSSDERERLYAHIKSRWAPLAPVLDRLDNDLRELSMLLGWSFSSRVLGSCFACRFAIASLRQITFDDSSEAKLRAVEQYLDIASSAFAVFDALVHMLGIPEERVYRRG